MYLDYGDCLGDSAFTDSMNNYIKNLIKNTSAQTVNMNPGRYSF